MQVFNVQGMTCGHCVKAVTKAIQALDGSAQVEVDLAGRQVKVQGTASAQRIVEALGEEGYQAQVA